MDAAEIVEKGALRVRMICEQTLVEKHHKIFVLALKEAIKAMIF